MKTLAPPSEALRQFLAAPAGKETQSSSVSGNPFLAPGINLMGRLQFGAKALVICLAFLLPLIFVTWKYHTRTAEAINFSAKELVGLRYAKEIFPALDAAQNVRRVSLSVAAGGAAAELSEPKSKLSAAMAKLDAVDKELGKELATNAALAAVRTAFAEAEKSSEAGAVFTAHTAHVESLVALIGVVADNSNLTLDPDVDSYYLMDAALFRVATVVEATGKLRGLGLGIMKTGSVTPAQRILLQRFSTLGEYEFGNMQTGLAKAFAYNPSLTSKIDFKETQDATQAFFGLAQKSLIDGEDFSPETQAAYLAAANKAIAGQYALTNRLLTELEKLIQIRVSDMQTSLWSTYFGFVVGLCLASYLFYCFFLVAKAGIAQLGRHLSEMAEGDLRSPPGKQWATDEPARLLEEMRNTYDALHALIRKVRHGARELHTASNEIASASMDLGGRTESAAAALEQQAAAMEEIGSQVKNASERSEMAASFAVENSSVAQRGGAVFTQVVATMQEIKSSSSRISDIISVIDGIAFQTNILALNAAVEAARAGEAGRGFAVVASEVRSLAGRSAEAAREIKSLISTSVANVENGTKIVEDAGKTMNDLVLNAQQIMTFLGDISTAAKEQAIGVREVTTAIQELDRNTQQNSALVEETMAAAGALTAQADTLQAEIANFRVA